MINKKHSGVAQKQSKAGKNFQFEIYDNEDPVAAYPGLNNQVVEEIEDYLNQQDALEGGHNQLVLDENEVEMEYEYNNYSGARGLLAEMEVAVHDRDIVELEDEDIIQNHKQVNYGQVH